MLIMLSSEIPYTILPSNHLMIVSKLFIQRFVVLMFIEFHIDCKRSHVNIVTQGSRSTGHAPVTGNDVSSPRDPFSNFHCRKTAFKWFPWSEDSCQWWDKVVGNCVDYLSSSNTEIAKEKRLEYITCKWKKRVENVV